MEVLSTERLPRLSHLAGGASPSPTDESLLRWMEPGLVLSFLRLLPQSAAPTAPSKRALWAVPCASASCRLPRRCCAAPRNDTPGSAVNRNHRETNFVKSCIFPLTGTKNSVRMNASQLKGQLAPPKPDMRPPVLLPRTGQGQTDSRVESRLPLCAVAGLPAIID